MRRVSLAAAITITALVIGGIAYASIPDSNGVIHGCRKNADGSLKAIDSAVTPNCPNGYTALNWSQTGPAGPQGPQGPQGPAVEVNFGPGDSATATGSQQIITPSCRFSGAEDYFAAGPPAIYVTDPQTGNLLADPNLSASVQPIDDLGIVYRYRVAFVATSGNNVTAELTCLRGIVPA